MPWKAMTTMSQRQEFVELALKENANIRALCREFDITPRTGYKWLKRYREEGNNGLYDRSRRPKNSPHKSNPVIEEAVLRVRRAHPTWGGRKIQWKLVQDGIKSPPAASTITTILFRNEMLNSEESLKHTPLQRFEMEYPNQLWQMDFKGQYWLLTHPSVIFGISTEVFTNLYQPPNLFHSLGCPE